MRLIYNHLDVTIATNDELVVTASGIKREFVISEVIQNPIGSYFPLSFTLCIVCHQVCKSKIEQVSFYVKDKRQGLSIWLRVSNLDCNRPFLWLQLGNNEVR